MKHAALFTGLAVAIGLGAPGLARAQAMGQALMSEEEMGAAMMSAGEAAMARGGAGEARGAGTALREMAASPEAADSDGDGRLGRAEIEAWMRARAARRIAARAERMIARLDADGDGMLDPAEMRAGVNARLFARLDSDGDGVISRAEFARLDAPRRNGSCDALPPRIVIHERAPRTR